MPMSFPPINVPAWQSRGRAGHYKDGRGMAPHRWTGTWHQHQFLVWCTECGELGTEEDYFSQYEEA